MPRDYSRVAPGFWTGPTGRAIRALGQDALLVALHLMTSPHATMLGLYYVPEAYIAHETGIPVARVRKALEGLAGLDFAHYDPASEHVWVVEMAQYQILEPDEVALKPGDNRIKGIRKAYAALPTNAHLGRFFDRYAEAFHLEIRRDSEATPGSPSEGASKGLPAQAKPLRSQEQEQEQEQDQEQERAPRDAPPSGASPASAARNGHGRVGGSTASAALDPDLMAVLAECPHLQLVATPASAAFWESVFAACEPYPLADHRWLTAKIR
ncbi:MAG TPA: hypothetical protein VF406_14015, partial [Thermodesulfobacteriota bacterium]